MANQLYDNLKLSAEIVSDVHLDIKHPNPQIPLYLFCSALNSAKRNKSDALITVGDTTSRGERVNWDYAREAFKKIPNCSKNIILIIGNHDCWSDGEDEYASGIGEYYSACEELMGRKLSKPYFSTYINGYSFICLGNESDMGCDADISDEQIKWLKNELDIATQNRKPAFVFCHQSLNGRHGLPRTWDKHEDPNRPPEEGGIGAKSDEIATLLKSYQNIFYFSGHSHMGLCGEKMQNKEGYSTFQCEDGLHLINLPSLSCSNHHGNKNGLGIGMHLEVYENKVVIRPKDYKCKRYIKTVSIKDGKPYYEAEII